MHSSVTTTTVFRHHLYIWRVGYLTGYNICCETGIDWQTNDTTQKRGEALAMKKDRKNVKQCLRPKLETLRLYRLTENE